MSRKSEEKIQRRKTRIERPQREKGGESESHSGGKSFETWGKGSVIITTQEKKGKSWEIVPRR